MSKYLKLSSIFILILFFASCRQNVTQNDYPDADAAYLKISKEYVLNENGTMEYHYTHTLKLFSYLAFNSKYGESFVIYNPSYQKLKINKSVTINEKGENIPSPENAKNEVLPHFAENAPAYNGLREMVITHTGLEKNATIDLEYSITSQAGYLPALMSNEVLNNSSPVKEYEITVKVPKSKKLHYKLLNSNVKPDSIISTKYITYRWKLKELPAQPLESMQPADGRHLVRLMFSTLSEPTFVYSYDLDNDIKQQVNDIAKANDKELNLALALQKKVVEEFNYYPVPSVYAGFKSRPAETIWKSNGGNELEKTVLLNSLLKTSGINAEVIAVSAPYYSVQDKIRLLFDNYFVKATLKNNDVIYLSAVHVNDYNPVYDLQGSLLYSVDMNAKTAAFNLNKEHANSIAVNGKLNLNNDNTLSGNINATYTDRFNPYFKYTVNPESAKSAFNNVMEAKIASLSKDKSVIDLTIENKKALQKEKNYIFFDIPEANNGVSNWGFNFLTEKRNTPLELPSDIDEVYKYTIQIPQDFKLLAGINNVSIKNNVGFVNISINYDFKFSEVQIYKEIKINNKVTETKDYNDLKILINTWNNKKYKELVFDENEKYLIRE